MSLVKKCLDYAAAHDGALPPFKKMDEFVHEQLGEYLKELSDAVIPEYFDIPVITAAYKLLYESRYNMRTCSSCTVSLSDGLPHLSAENSVISSAEWISSFLGIGGIITPRPLCREAPPLQGMTT